MDPVEGSATKMRLSGGVMSQNSFVTDQGR